jgi:hypothetical protein
LLHPNLFTIEPIIFGVKGYLDNFNIELANASTKIQITFKVVSRVVMKISWNPFKQPKRTILGEVTLNKCNHLVTT